MKIIKTSEALPKSGRYVLAWLQGAKIPMRAMWAAQHTLPLGDDADPEWGEYSEEKDEYFCPAGWYEMNQHEEQHWGVDGNVVAWCELPRLDHQCLAQIEEPAQPVCWIRFCSDGSTEGPIMHSQICEARKTSGAWTPLYAGAAPAAVAGLDLTVAGYRVSLPSEPELGVWLSETPGDDQCKSETLYAIATPTLSKREQVLAACRKIREGHSEVAAVKHYRDVMGSTLREAHDAVKGIPTAAAPALEAPAAPGCLPLTRDEIATWAAETLEEVDYPVLCKTAPCAYELLNLLEAFARHLALAAAPTQQGSEASASGAKVLTDEDMEALSLTHGLSGDVEEMAIIVETMVLDRLAAAPQAPAPETVAWLNKPIKIEGGEKAGDLPPTVDFKRHAAGHEWLQAEPLVRLSDALAYAKALAAAPQAPAAPVGDVISDGEFAEMAVAAGAQRVPGYSPATPPVFPSWGAWGRFCDSVRAAPAAPAVDAQAERDTAFEAVRKRLCALQRYSFVLDDDGVVRRAEDRTGSWIEFDDAHALFDPVAVDAAIAAQAKEGGAAC